jgi:hypothetical protein
MRIQIHGVTYLCKKRSQKTYTKIVTDIEFQNTFLDRVSRLESYSEQDKGFPQPSLPAFR